MYVLHSCTHTWTLSGFKADFNPLLGTSDSPANDASGAAHCKPI